MSILVLFFVGFFSVFDCSFVMRASFVTVGLCGLAFFLFFLFMFTAKWDNAIDYGWTINRISTDIAAEWTFQMTEATSTEYMAPPLLLQYKSILVQPLPILPCVDSKFRLLSNVEVAGGQRGGLHFEGWIMTLLCLPWSKSVNWSLSEGSLWCATFFLSFFFRPQTFLLSSIHSIHNLNVILFGGDLYIDIKIKLNTSAGKMNANNASLKVF